MCPTGTRSYTQTTKKSELRAAFDVLDADRDGKISRDDLQTFYTNFPIKPSSENDDVIGSMISGADSNKNGYVEYDEFEKVLCRRERNGEMEVMEEVFRVMDRDGDGKVSYGDLKTYLSLAGVEVGDGEIEAMIKLGGGDQNGGVTFDGLLKILAV